jgi:hypothetical protein
MDAFSCDEPANAFTLIGQLLLLYSVSAAATAAVEFEYAQSPGSHVVRCSCVLLDSAPDSMRPSHSWSAQLLIAASMDVAVTPAAVSASNRPLKMAHEQLSHSSWPLKRSKSTGQQHKCAGKCLSAQAHVANSRTAAAALCIACAHVGKMETGQSCHILVCTAPAVAVAAGGAELRGGASHPHRSGP